MKSVKRNHDASTETLTKTKKFKKEATGKFEKGSSNQLTDKPPDWKEFKKEKKELRLKRKRAKTCYDVIVEAKQISEKLRRKNLEGGKEERDRLVATLHRMLGRKGNYVNFVMSHDMGRVVQYLLKFGKQEIRDDIAKELIPSTVLLIQSVYGRFCIKTLLKYGNSQIRSDVLKACYGSAVKLTSHSVSAHIFEFAYSTYAHSKEKQHLIQEFFGDIYKKSKDDNVKHLRDVYKDSPDMKKAALECTKANLQRVLNKKLLDSGLVQSVLFQYLSECSETDRSELLSQLAPHAVVLSNSKDGARVVTMCMQNGTNKDRKVVTKAFKEHIIDLCKHEHGHTAVIALLDLVDDTVLLNKAILTGILINIMDLAKNEWGRKVLLWLVSPGSSEHFHPTFIAELEKGHENSTCKKSRETRREEILTYCRDLLMDSIMSETKVWFESASMSVLAVMIIKTGSKDKLRNVFENISKVIVDPEWQITENGKLVSGIEHAGLHMTLKKLLQHDKKLISEESNTFSGTLCDALDDKTLKMWTKLNRGCFILVAILENGPSDVQDKLKSNLNAHIERLKKQSHAGAQVLLKKLD